MNGKEVIEQNNLNQNVNAVVHFNMVYNLHTHTKTLLYKLQKSQRTAHNILTLKMMGNWVDGT